MLLSELRVKIDVWQGSHQNWGQVNSVTDRNKAVFRACYLS